jgi:hypothetical protein
MNEALWVERKGIILSSLAPLQGKLPYIFNRRAVFSFPWLRRCDRKPLLKCLSRGVMDYCVLAGIVLLRVLWSISELRGQWLAPTSSEAETLTCTPSLYFLCLMLTCLFTNAYLSIRCLSDRVTGWLFPQIALPSVTA